MLWRDGVMRRHVPRRRVSFAVRGMLDRDRVTMAPPLAGRFGDPRTRARMAEINALPRTAKSFALAEEMLAAMQRFGSIEHASNLADRLARQGVARFERDLRFLPENPGKAVLRQVANYMVTRAL